MEPTSNLYHDILYRLRRARSKQQLTTLTTGAFITATAALLLVLAVVLLEQIFSFGITGRTVLFAAASIGMAGCFVWFVIRPLLQLFGLLPTDDDLTFARTVGDHFPHIRDHLVNALQVFQASEDERALYSPKLIGAALEDLYHAVQPLDFSTAVDTTLLRRTRKFGIYALAVFLSVFVLSPSGFLSSFERVLNFHVAYASPSPIEFVVEPGNMEVVRGTSVAVTVRTIGRPVAKLILRTRQSGQVNFDARELMPVNAASGQETVFRDSLFNLRSTTEYFAAVGDIESKKFTIAVLDRPLIRSFRAHLQYPPYTRLPAKVLDENVGDITAYKGTIVSLQIASSKKLTSASLVLSDGGILPMSVDGTQATVRFPLSVEKSYHVALVDEESLTNADPIQYQLRILPDAYPTVTILVPGRNVDVTEQMQLDLLIRITDDFGFSKLRLAHRLAHSRYEKPSEEFVFTDILLPSRDQITHEVWHRWSLTRMGLVPEDVVAYYVEVFDNDNVSGPKAAQSETYLVRLPSLDEVFRDVAQIQTQSLESLLSAHSELQQLRKELTDLHNEMKRDRQKVDWQQQKKAEEMSKRFEELKKKLDETAHKMDEALNQMQENKLLSKETLEKYLELQKLMEEFDAPELQEALRKLQEAMKQLSPEQIREAMQKLQMSEEIFRKSLERTIELLKRIAIEQKMDELLKRTEQLIRQQESVREQTAQTEPSDQKQIEDLARQQQDLQQQLEAMREQLADLQKKMEEFPAEMPLEQMSKAQQDLDQQQLGEQMQDALQQIRSGQMQSAQRNQQRISQGLQQFHEQMQSAQRAMRENQLRQAMNEMRKALQNTLELSKRQEQLKEETSELDPNSPRFREQAQQQMEILDDLNKVANTLTQLSRKSFVISPEMGREIGKAMQQMMQSMQSMEQRNPGGAYDQQNEAMGSLNRAAMMMQRALSSLMQGGGMGLAGLMQQLQGMTGMQMGINAQSQAMMGQGISPQQAAEWARLAGQQEVVRKSLQELAHEAEMAGELSKLLGDLDRIAQDMMEVQTDMEQGNVNPETLRKQERILSRLLDSQRSMRERDYEKRRRAEVGKEIIRTSPADIDLATQEGRSKLRQELLKVIEQRYSKDYEELIRRYFEALEKEEVPR